MAVTYSLFGLLVIVLYCFCFASLSSAQPCSIPDCQTCNGDGTACDVCNQGWGPDGNGGCDYCEFDCDECNQAGAFSCDICFEGYLLTQKDDGSGFHCPPCQASYCKNCTSDPACDECIDGAYLHPEYNKCASCPVGCANCTDSSNCEACLDGYAQNDTICQPCAANCSKCSTEGPGFCDENECRNPASPRNDTSKLCEPCAEHCFKCSSVGLCDSDGCHIGYRRNDGETCEKCEIERCANCNTNISTCDLCGPRTRYDETKLECELCALNCQSCQQNGPGKCDTCQPDCYEAFDIIGNAGRGRQVTVCDGYRLNGQTKKCERCKASDCLNCDSQDPLGQCDQCPIGFYTDYTVLCKRCVDKFPYCVRCGQFTCLQCEAGYTVSGGGSFCSKDSNCPSDCESCDFFYFGGRCDFCNIGFGLTPEKTCKACTEYCIDCTVFGAGSCDPGFCRPGYRKVGDKCELIGLNGCQKASSPGTCDECYPEGYHYNNDTKLCENCTNSFCVDCDASPSVCTKCAQGSRIDGTDCIPCEKYCLRCNDTACLECGTIKKDELFYHIPNTDAILQPDTSSAKCISLCAGQHGNFYNEPVPDVLCPYEEPHGVCIHGNLFRFNCRNTPILSARWNFEYYRRNYTLTNTCEGHLKGFAPTILPPRHFAFNNPLTAYFKDYKDMSPGFISETVATFLEASPTSKPETVDGSPLAVGIEIFIASIYDVDDIKMQYRMTFWVRVYYHNCKLAFEGFNHEYEYVTLDNHDYLRFWMPDIFFLGERSTRKHTFSSPNLFMRLYKDGTLVTNQKVTVTLACNMKLQRFPLDKQSCPMQLGSFTYPLTEMTFNWHDTSGRPPLTVHHSAKDLPEFDLVHAENRSCLVYDTFVGGYPCLEVHLEFKRKLAFYLEQVYMPSALLVMISWIGPWVDKSITGSRTSIGLLTVLTVVTQAVGVNSRLPKVSYIKAVDVWMGACLIQVVGGMLEFCIVNVITRAQEKKNEEEEEADAETFKKSLQGRRKSEAIKLRFQYERKRDKAHFIDLVARVVFPVFFLVFNIIYWTYYLAIFTENPT